jgi:hypothetical protein
VVNVENLRLEIDENNLPVEWQGQANMMLQVGVDMADAQQEADEAQARFSVVVAKLDAAIRAEPAEFGISKVTETTVQHAVVRQPEHIAAQGDLFAARHTLNVMKAAVQAVQHRKSALQGMTDLWLRQWHAEPRESDLGTTQPPAGPPAKRKTRRPT